MAKRKNIKIEPDSTGIVLGIASNERIWKLCWEINQTMQINLSEASRELDASAGTEVYADCDSSESFDYFLVENNGRLKGVPKEAKPFRFWIMVRPKGEREADHSSILQQLKTNPSVSLATDLSNNQELKKALLWI